MIHHQGHIFRVGSHLTDMRCVRVKYDPRGVHPIGAKVLVDKNEFNYTKAGGFAMKASKLKNHLLDIGVPPIQREIRTHALFPARHSGGLFNQGQVDVDNLKVVNGNRLFNLHYIKPVNEFHMNDMESIRNYVVRWGAITLKFMNHQSATNFISQLKQMFKLYNHSCTFGSNFQHTGSDFFKHDTCKFFATFIDVSYCVPIWNPKKVDGMGLIISLLSDGSGGSDMPLVSFNSSIMMTNYEENVFKVDGAIANQRENVGDDLISTLLEMAGYAKKHEEYHKGKEGKAKVGGKAKAKKKEGGVVFNKSATYRYTSSNTYGGSSTATTYYTTS